MLPCLCVCLSLNDADQVLYTYLRYLHWMLQWAEGTGWRIFSSLWDALSFCLSVMHAHTQWKSQITSTPPHCASEPACMPRPWRVVCNKFLSMNLKKLVFVQSWALSIHSSLILQHKQTVPSLLVLALSGCNVDLTCSFETILRNMVYYLGQNA